jgi:hypothetical protein
MSWVSLSQAIPVLALLALLGAVYSLGIVIYCLFRVLDSIRPDKRRLANFVAPLVLFWPDFFLPIGLPHLRRF